VTLKEVIKHLEKWEESAKTGSIQVNFFKGGISNINLTQCIKTEIKAERRLKK
jgi:hypothetical protein